MKQQIKLAQCIRDQQNTSDSSLVTLACKATLLGVLILETLRSDPRRLEVFLVLDSVDVLLAAVAK